MAIEGVSGLLGDLEVSFGLPLLGFAMFAVNRTVSGKLGRSKRNEPLLQRIAITFCLSLFLYLFISLMQQDRAVLAAVWHSSPVLYSVVYGASTLLIVGGIFAIIRWKVRPTLWTTGNRESHA